MPRLPPHPPFAHYDAPLFTAPPGDNTNLRPGWAGLRDERRHSLLTSLFMDEGVEDQRGEGTHHVTMHSPEAAWCKGCGVRLTSHASLAR